ncbi:MAG TPA: hypothetical protein VI958_07540 [Acidobacteriota bacterium]
MNFITRAALQLIGDNWGAVVALLFVAVVISLLTASARENARKSEVLETTLRQLNDFRLSLLSLPRDLISLSGIAENARRIFSLEYCSIHVYSEGRWHHFSGSSIGSLSKQVADTLKATQDHPTALMELVEEQSLGVRYSRIRTGSESFAVLAVKSEHLPPDAIDAIASMTGILLLEVLREDAISTQQRFPSYDQPQTRRL